MHNFCTKHEILSQKYCKQNKEQEAKRQIYKQEVNAKKREITENLTEQEVEQRKKRRKWRISPE